MIRFGLSWELTLSHHELNVTSKGQPQWMGAAHAPNEAALMDGGGSCMHASWPLMPRHWGAPFHHQWLGA